MTNFEKHFDGLCGHSSRVCRYCHPDKELCQDDLKGWLKIKKEGVVHKYKILTSMLEIEARNRNRFDKKHFKQLEMAFNRQGKYSLSKMIMSRIVKRLKIKVVNDGKQTPYLAHGIDVAFHTTGVCCRTCVYHWHNIEQNHILTEQEMKYLLDVVYTYITEFVLPEGSFRSWITSKSEGSEIRTQPYYIPGRYKIVKNDDKWEVLYLGESLYKELTNWNDFLKESKNKYGNNVNITNLMIGQ
uniref:Uncharacterized protein n=1 Tax=Pithovirus LCPAC001 TaxID=2506585 RepID=A0A481Z275_9VIRU|nr:MAG: protein of unknown function DUF4186 [Pithovirus LCPAC001]